MRWACMAPVLGGIESGRGSASCGNDMHVAGVVRVLAPDVEHERENRV